MVFEKKINIPKGSVNLSKTKLKEILNLCTPSEQFVLVEKYGLVKGQSTSMQQIGKKFDMSRERIRQILNKSLNKVRRLVNHDKKLLNIINVAHEIIKKNNYLMLEKELINTIIETTKTDLSYQEILLLLTADYDLYYLHRNKRFKKIFYIKPVFEDLINNIHDTTINILEKERKALQIDDLINTLQSIFLQKFQRNQSVINLLNNKDCYVKIFKLSRDLYLLDNKVGLENHVEVNPKTIKLKILYILLKEGKPLHYKEITEKIKKNFSKKKEIKSTTVHNELVKNPEFINVGMGIYGLAKWGYNGKNTLDLIISILKKANRPMKVSEIAKEVLKERLIREITVLMILQKNPHLFKREKKGVYSLIDNKN